MNRYWISWWHLQGVHGGFELHFPWWCSGYRPHDDASSICAAVGAANSGDAAEVVLASYDVRPELEFRFCEVRPDDWEPFSSRFPRADWMRWPPLPVEVGAP